MWDWVYLIPLVGIVITIGVPIATIICHYLFKMKQMGVITTGIEKGEAIPPEVLAALTKIPNVHSKRSLHESITFV